MKKFFTFNLQLFATIAIMLASVQTTTAQTTEAVGYTNIYIKMVETPQGSGKVCALANTNGLKAFSEEYTFKQTLTVYRMTVNYEGESGFRDYVSYYLHAKPNDGYVFAGWYSDVDSDGELDYDIDQLINTNPDYPLAYILDNNETVYATKAEAQAAGFPEEPVVVFGNFTNGATVDLSYYQDADFANCGSVYIDKPVNKPGDEVTVRAIANDGFQFEYWSDSRFMGNVVSTENPYTFTVEGGEQLYAYFTATDAPVVELPEDGGFKVIQTEGRPWVMTEEAMKNGAHILVLEQEDFTRTDDGKVYLDMNKEDVWIDVCQGNNLPSIVYGKGTVRFAFKMNYNLARKYANQTLVRWSGDNGVNVSGENIYVYTFDENLGAFITCGNTDTTKDPNAPTKVKVPAKQAFMWMSAFDLADSNGNIPDVIGLSPETFDNALGGIEGVTVTEKEAKGLKIYTLNGVEVEATGEKGIYIINGKKVVVK